MASEISKGSYGLNPLLFLVFTLPTFLENAAKWPGLIQRIYSSSAPSASSTDAVAVLPAAADPSAPSNSTISTILNSVAQAKETVTSSEVFKETVGHAEVGLSWAQTQASSVASAVDQAIGNNIPFMPMPLWNLLSPGFKAASGALICFGLFCLWRSSRTPTITQKIEITIDGNKTPVSLPHSGGDLKINLRQHEPERFGQQAPKITVSRDMYNKFVQIEKRSNPSSKWELAPLGQKGVTLSEEDYKSLFDAWQQHQASLASQYNSIFQTEENAAE